MRADQPSATRAIHTRRMANELINTASGGLSTVPMRGRVAGWLNGLSARFETVNEM
jgi:hypothetical protein